jgi:hypothetical protein
MQITKSEQIRPFDVDGCLITEPSGHAEHAYAVEIIDPVTKRPLRFKVNKAMVRLIKEEHQRGGYVIVWSRSGWEWARNVVQALDLVPCVDQVMSKPIVYFDNEPVKNWMKDRVFIDFDIKYKE